MTQSARDRRHRAQPLRPRRASRRAAARPTPRRWLLAQFERYEPQPAGWAAQPSSAALLVGLRRAAARAAPGRRRRARSRRARSSPPRCATATAPRSMRASRARSSRRRRSSSGWCISGPTTSRSRSRSRRSDRSPARSRPRRSARTCSAASRTCWSRSSVIRRCCSTSTRSRSIGPDSVAARRAAQRNPERKRGLNENLAREILELHTLGVRSGYSQDDVTEFARALTGWSVGGAGRPVRDAAGHRAGPLRRSSPALHEPGARTRPRRALRASRAKAQALAILRDLAVAPATARHIATKLARHFAGDAPPPALVDRLAERVPAQRRRPADASTAR